MKNILIAALVLASSSAFAASNDHEKAASWIKSKLNGQKGIDILGQTQDGKRCGFYLTDIDGGLFYVVVGLDNAKDMNDYIGITTTPESEIKVNGSNMVFHLNQSWGNDSKTNTVSVELNANGSPVRATGISDLKTITCNLTGESKSR